MAHYNRYSFGGDIWQIGQRGQIPSVQILGNEQLPSLDMLSNVTIRYVDNSSPEETHLELAWTLNDGTEDIAFVRAECRANNPEMKEAYKSSPKIAEKIVDFILQNRGLTSQRGSSGKSLILSGKLLIGGVPEVIRHSAHCVIGWKKFISQINLSPALRYGSRVESEGGEEFLLIPLMACEVKLPDGTNGGDDDDHDYYPRYIKLPEIVPIVEDSAIYFSLWNQHIALVILHEASSDRIARHYGYFQTLTNFRKEKKGQREKEDSRRQVRSAQMAEEDKEISRKFRNDLLS